MPDRAATAAMDVLLKSSIANKYKPAINMAPRISGADHATSSGELFDKTTEGDMSITSTHLKLRSKYPSSSILSTGWLTARGMSHVVPTVPNGICSRTSPKANMTIAIKKIGHLWVMIVSVRETVFLTTEINPRNIPIFLILSATYQIGSNRSSKGNAEIIIRRRNNCKTRITVVIKTVPTIHLTKKNIQRLDAETSGGSFLQNHNKRIPAKYGNAIIEVKDNTDRVSGSIKAKLEMAKEKLNKIISQSLI